MFKTLSIKIKIDSLIIASLTSLTIILAVFSVQEIKQTLIEQNYLNLTSSRDSKSAQIENFFQQKANHIKVLSKSAKYKRFGI